MYLFFFLISLSATAATEAAGTMSSILDQFTEDFFNSPRVKQISQELKGQYLRSATAVRDRGLSVSATLSDLRSPKVSNSELADRGGTNSLEQRNLNSRLTLGLRDVGILNSTEFQFESSWVTRQFQKTSNQISTINSYRDYSFQVSYDMNRGGENDLTYVQNKATEKSQLGSFLNSTSTLIQTFIQYRSQLLDVFGSYCKLKTSTNDLEVMKKAVSEIKLSYQLKAIPYKQYLNILDTVNFIQRNNISYGLNYEINLQRLLMWSELTREEWEARISKSFSCPTQNDQFMSLINDGEIKPIRYRSTIISNLAQANFETAKFNQQLTQLTYKPSVRPYLGIGKEDSSGFDNKRIELGVTFKWDSPSQKNKGEIIASGYSAGAAQASIKNNELQFHAMIRAYQISLKKNKELLELSIASLDNSNKLVNLLEVQKSIGQVDSLSLSNAFTQRNQILNSMFDSLINLEKTRQELYFLAEWKKVVRQAGVEIN